MVMMNISTLSDRLRKKRDTLFRRSASDLDDRVVQEWQYLKFDPNRTLRAGSTSEKPQVAPPRPGAFQRLTRATSTLGLSGTLPRSIASGALNANAEKARVAPLWAGTKIRPPPNGVRSPERVVSPVNAAAGSRIPIRMPSLRLKPSERREQIASAAGSAGGSAQERLLTKRYSLENLLEETETDGGGCICEECVNRNNNREHKRRSSQCIEVKALEKSRRLLGKTKSAPDYAAEKADKKTPNGKDQAAADKAREKESAEKAKDKRLQHRRQRKAAQKASERASQKAFDKAKKEQKQQRGVAGKDATDSGPTRRAGDRAAPVSGRPDQRRPDTVTEKDERRGDDIVEGADVGSTNSGPPQIGKKPASTSITRSESYRDHRNSRRHTREKRKHSDPNIPSSKVSDVDLDSQGLCNNNHSGSSSSSSLSNRQERQESPSASLDSVSVGGRVAGTLAEGTPGWDSDMEVDADPPDWQRSIDAETRRHLRPKEKQRLDVVNELFHTERTHVRNLKVLVHLFNRPMINLNILQPNDINLLFGNLEELLEIHSKFNAAMKKRQKEDPMMEKVGDILVNMFEGEQGESFKTAAAAFCRCQSIALDKLKALQKRDQRLAAFLLEAESDPVCRRLQLKDILPTAMQRLTKYPLLLTNLAKYTVRGSEDHALVLRCCEKSKAILEHVNKVKGETERHERLVEIQNKLEQNGFSRVDNAIVNEFNGRLDLTKYRMVHEGPVMWKFSNKGKHVELHMILLEEFIVLLQKQDDKYVLKFHTVTGRDISPIVKNENILVRPMATEKRAFFILHNLNVGPQIYELLFSSSSERDLWYRLIKEAADSYQGRDGKGHKRTESAHTLLTAQDSSEAPTPPPPSAAASGAEESSEGAAAASPAGAEAALSPGAASPADASPAASPTAPRSQLTAKAAAAADGAASPGEKRRMQRVEMLKIAECTQLIDPAEVVVSQGVVLSAEPVLTPIERLRRKDEQVRQTLAEKQQLVADILQIPRDDFAHIAEMAAESGGEKDARELILNSILSVDRNISIINETLKVTEGDIVSSTCTPGPPESPGAGGAAAAAGGPAGAAAAVGAEGTPRRPVSPRPRRAERSRMAAIHQLLQVNSQLSATLTTLLGVMTERDEERERMRKELRYSHERIYQLHAAASGALAAPPAAPPAAAAAGAASPSPAPLAAPETDTSRPHSFVSVGSSSDVGGGGSGTGPPEHAETDDESSRSRPDTGSHSQESGEPASDTLEESTHETETFDSASSGSACLTFESAADQT